MTWTFARPRIGLNRIYFWVSVEGVPTYPNVWAHGADTPTVFPQVDVLESCQ